MNQLLEFLAAASAVLGILACFAAGSTLVTGNLWVLGFDPASLFIGGMAALILACLAKLYQRPKIG